MTTQTSDNETSFKESFSTAVKPGEWFRQSVNSVQSVSRQSSVIEAIETSLTCINRDLVAAGSTQNLQLFSVKEPYKELYDRKSNGRDKKLSLSISRIDIIRSSSLGKEPQNLVEIKSDKDGWLIITYGVSNEGFTKLLKNAYHEKIHALTDEELIGRIETILRKSYLTCDEERKLHDYYKRSIAQHAHSIS